MRRRNPDRVAVGGVTAPPHPPVGAPYPQSAVGGPHPQPAVGGPPTGRVAGPGERGEPLSTAPTTTPVQTPAPARSRRRPLRLLVIVTLVAVAVAGCTNGGGSDRPGSTDGSGGGGAPQGRRGGTLSIALLDPGPLEPARAESLAGEVVPAHLFHRL